MKTVLVVDDEFDLTATMRAILDGEGYRTDTCSNGREALERLKKSPPDLVVMDVMMPILSGYEVLRVMRATPGLDRVPVILMSCAPTAVKQDEYHWQAVLRKPFTLSALVTAVANLIQNPELARDEQQ